MVTPVILLEVMGEALLAAQPDGHSVIDRPRLAREFWSSWVKDRPPEERRAAFQAFRTLSAEEQQTLVIAAIRQILPGRSDSSGATLHRYHAAVTSHLATDGRTIETADDLARRLPCRVPHLHPGDRPQGIGDWALVQPLVILPTCEVWQVQNPRVPRLRGAFVAFYLDLAANPQAKENLAAYINQLATFESSRILMPLRTCLDAEIPWVEFTAPDRPILGLEDLSPDQARQRFLRAVRLIADFHLRTPPITVGPLEISQIIPTPGSDREPDLRLLLPTQAGHDDPREDVYTLGLLGKSLLGPDSSFNDVLSSCTAPDRLNRPANASALLTLLEAMPATPPVTSPVRRRDPGQRRSTDVNRILGELQQAAPEAPKLVTNSAGMRFVLIQPATFRMGSPVGEMGRRDNEGPVHEVVFSRPFYLAVHLTTQEQYERVLGSNPAHFTALAGGGPSHPVECVSWEDVIAFCQKLCEREQGRVYRLPTEAEWEFACRAGTTTPFCFGATLTSQQASFDGAHPYATGYSEAERAASITRSLTAQRTTPVGSFEANRFGLYDMHGNVWEWCADWYDAAYYRASPRQDPPGPESGMYRVLRGGSWKNQAVTCRSAYRNALTANQRQPTIGFRVVLEVSS